MNRVTLEAEVVEKTNISPKIVSQVMAATFEAITEALARGEKVSYAGFASLSLKHRPTRPGKNPKTGEQIIVPERWKVVFRSGKSLDQAVNPGLSEA